jgi:hypothetical protein
MYYRVSGPFLRKHPLVVAAAGASFTLLVAGVIAFVQGRGGQQAYGVLFVLAGLGTGWAAFRAFRRVTRRAVAETRRMRLLAEYSVIEEKLEELGFEGGEGDEVLRSRVRDERMLEIRLERDPALRGVLVEIRGPLEASGALIETLASRSVGAEELDRT